MSFSSSSDPSIFFQGKFTNGKFHGEGNITDKNGEIIQEGIWQSDVYRNEDKTVSCSLFFHVLRFFVVAFVLSFMSHYF